MKIFKNKKLMIVLSCIVAVCLIFGCILYFSLSKTTDEKNEPNTPENAQITDAKETETKAETEKNETNETTEKPNINEGNGPVNIQNGDDLVGKIDKFNSLNDGDPEKEKIRKELEDLFAYAEGTTLN